MLFHLIEPREKCRQDQTDGETEKLEKTFSRLKGVLSEFVSNDILNYISGTA